jgi:hypothetical protein
MENLVITADAHQFIMGRPVTRKDKDGKAMVEIKNPRYYTDLASAVRGAISQSLRAGVAGNEITDLRSFLDEYQRLTEMFSVQLSPLASA